MIEERTANSATFKIGLDRFTTLVAAAPMHYRDDEGGWQPLDPAFRATKDGWTIENSRLKSRAGQRTAWISTGAGDTIVLWQATSLGIASGSSFRSLATALPESPKLPAQRDDGRTLRYSAGWTDPTLDEELVSTPDSLEHLLVLKQKPQVSGGPEWLELRASLKLMPGATLWADGQTRSSAFSTAGALEIRNQKNETTLVFDPVLAFEQDHPQVKVAGEYRLQPTGEPSTWIMSVRTPWSWWNDAERQYPAAIDPTMHVLQPTGYGKGLAWVNQPGVEFNDDLSDDEQDSDPNFGYMILGSYLGTVPYRGYIQFNNLPYMLTHAPISVTSALLDVTPLGVRMPQYSYTCGSDEECFEYDHEMHPQSALATLYDINCGGTPCNGFSLAGQQSAGSDLGELADRVVARHQDDGRGRAQGDAKSETSSWNVTNQIRTWNKQNPRPADGPAFRLSINNICPTNIFDGSLHFHIPACNRFRVNPDGVQLRINYDAPPLAVGTSWLNRPGVPSYLKDIFEKNTTNHQYDLAPYSGSTRYWRAVAVRSNHAIQPAAPGRVWPQAASSGRRNRDRRAGRR